MQQEQRTGKEPRSEVIHARLSTDLKGRIETYCEAHGLSMSSAVSNLLERSLDDDSTMDAMMKTLSHISERLDSMAKDCGLASKRAGKASQASLGGLALLCAFAPDLLRFLANEALMRGQMLARVLDNKQAAEKVKVPASLGRLANAKEPAEVFQMAYSELGGKLSRDPKTSFLAAWASAVELFDLADLGLMGRDAEDWDSLLHGSDARAMDALATKARKEQRNG